MSVAPIRILLIEDNRGDVRLIRALLRDVAGTSFEVECADRLVTGLQRLSAGADVILLDLELPDSRGIETLTTVRARAPDVPIIVITGLSDESVAIAAIQRGAQDYLVKGASDGKLLAHSIRYAIERGSAQRKLQSSERRQLEATNTELTRHRRELQTANRELESFTYSVSHDLRAPIRHIDGFSQILTEQLGPDIDPTALRYLRHIQESNAQMGRLVEDLLLLAQVGRQDVRPRMMCLDAAVEEVLSELQSDLDGREIRWKIDHLPTVRCDPALMKVVFANLLENAVKYTRPRVLAVIEVSHTLKNGQPVIYVRDNGVGFDMKYADKLFGVFQRLHRAEEFEGTGVGLATVQRLVHKHGGEIWAEAEPGKGATFYFTVGADLSRGPAGEMTMDEPSPAAAFEETE